MSKNNVGLIVEGHTEYLSFQRHTPRKYIKRARRFSGSAKIETIAEEIASLSRILSANCRIIIAVLDREGRIETRVELEDKIEKALKKFNISKILVIIVCADRMFENWLLADVASIKSKLYVKNTAKQKNFEGKNGVDELKKIFEKKYSYNKTTHGVELYNLLDSRVASGNSSSYTKFLNNL